ncbi:DNA polymerase III subunit beta [Patescibacteria group bacterium AH-259-L05]|nr:DNA polymerase III subunit beta [Patescibacteria group bacterium AH-259-L05]
MKFSCRQENISYGLNIGSKIAGTSKSSLPILNNVLLSAESGTLIISATNLEMAIEVKIRAKVEKQGKITIPAQILNNYINLLNENEVLNFKAVKNELNITSENQKTKIKGEFAEEFPIIPHIESKEQYILKSKTLKNALEKTVFAISSTEVRAELSGVLFSFNTPHDNKITLVSTDSYRLCEKQIDIKKTSHKNKKNIIIPVRTLVELLRVIKDKDDIEVSVSENQVLFKYDDVEIITRIISGEFPNYKSTIPPEFRTKVLIKRESFLTAVKGAGFFTRLGVNDINIQFIAKNNKLVVSSLNNQLGENQTTLKADISGEDNEIVFNYHYLIDGLTNIKGKEVSLEIVNDNMPGVIRSEDDKHYLYLIMPIKNS